MIRFMLRALKIKLLMNCGYTTFMLYEDRDREFIQDKVVDIHDVPKNVVPLAVNSQVGLALKVKFKIPCLRDAFQPVHPYYMIRVCEAYDGGGLVDGTLLLLKKSDAVMLRLIMD